MIVTGANWTMYRGDCLDVLPTIGMADHCITDPPYEAEAHTKQRRVMREGGLTVAALDFDPLTEEIRDCVAMQCDRIVLRWSMFFCQIEAVAAWRASVEATSMNFRRAGVWIKPDGMPQLTGDRPGMGFESIVFVHRSGRSKWNGGGRTGVFVHNKNDPDHGSHPTTKPRSLMLELAKSSLTPSPAAAPPASPPSASVGASSASRRIQNILICASSACARKRTDRRCRPCARNKYRCLERSDATQKAILQQPGQQTQRARARCRRRARGQTARQSSRLPL